MPSSKKPSKTNKTAHVLNVITGGREPAEPAEERTATTSADNTPAPVQAPVPRPPVAPILEMARADDDALSAAILNALTEEVTGEKPAEATPGQAAEAVPEAEADFIPKPAPIPGVADAAPATENFAVSPAAETDIPVPEPEMPVPQPEPVPVPESPAPQPGPASVPEPPPPQPEPVPMPESPAPQPEPAPAPERPAPQPEAAESAEKTQAEKYYEANKDIEYHNVTQALVEDKADKYMQMMGMCRCPRCTADVKALALSNLTPKYIVAHRSTLTPMLSYYEGRYGAAITAQIFSACRMVMEHPRH